MKLTYGFLKRYLRQNGYDVYPHEMICGPIGCPHEQNRFVDVVARKNGCFYAFEYKSAGDNLLRAVAQVENYRKSFDYVIVVAEIPRHDISVDPGKGVRIHDILKLGAGLWIVHLRHVRPKMWEKTKRRIADVFRDISWKAPIESHEVGTKSNGKLDSNRKIWFWMFYSVLDRRSDASQFIKAREILEQKRLFSPLHIVRLIREVGKDEAIKKIARLLRRENFPLLKDHSIGDLSQPRSIVEAAQFISEHNFRFETLYGNYLKVSGGNRVLARNALWKDLKNKIYGVGERIASQFIRGMVLKGPWDFPLNDDKFLEKCKFNVKVAMRLGLVTDANRYREQLGEFAEKHLYGNRGIIAHVLWYLRKNYCPKCYDCPLFDFCYVPKTTKAEVAVVREPKLQTPIAKNREWVELKFLRKKIPVLKIPPNPSQRKLELFY